MWFTTYAYYTPNVQKEFPFWLSGKTSTGQALAIF